jgi:CubicO group peptidase (beta-lactamase class C family)
VVTTIQDMALWEQEQRAPRLMKPEPARLAQQSLMLDDGSLTNYGYGWFTGAVLGVPARHHSEQTAGFVAEYLRFPERDLAIVVLANRYDAPALASRVAVFADSSLGGTAFIAAQNFDPTRVARVRQVVA